MTLQVHSALSMCDPRDEADSSLSDYDDLNLTVAEGGTPKMYSSPFCRKELTF